MDIERSTFMTYKNRLENLKRLYKDTEVATSPLLSDYACAILAGTPKILQQGRMYITVGFICFYCRLLRYEQKILIKVSDIVELTKEKTAIVFPNAIQIITKNNEKYFFTSFTTRDRTFHIIHKIWSENKSSLELSTPVIWDRIRENYGNDLGFTLDDPEFEESKATQFTARYKIIRRPSEVQDTSSQDDSIYESFDDSISNDSKDENSFSFNSNDSKSNGYKKSLSQLKLIDEDEIKFDLHFLKNSTEESRLRKMNLLTDNVILPKLEIPLVPAICKDHEHHSSVTLDEEFNINVTTLWTYLFTDNPFFRALCAMRLMVDVIQSNWPEDSDINGDICRTIYYTVNLKNKIGPKRSPTVEKQVRLAGSQDNYIYLTESTVRTVGIPFSDSFHVVVQCCLLYVNPTRSRIKLSMKVVYDKSVFFGTKSIIESSVRSGCLDYSKDLKSSLIKESKKINSSSLDEVVYQSQTCIEDSYTDPIIHPCIENFIFKETSQEIDENKVSWMTMVLICFIAFLLLYVIKELRTDPYDHSLSKSSSHNQPTQESSINELIELIQEMKSAIEVLKNNIEILNKSNPCSLQSNGSTDN